MKNNESNLEMFFPVKNLAAYKRWKKDENKLRMEEQYKKADLKIKLISRSELLRDKLGGMRDDF